MVTKMKMITSKITERVMTKSEGATKSENKVRESRLG